jgi:hypothetical protein
MDRSSLETVVGALNAASVRYLVVGGLAVIAHGYLRLTKDLDLVLSLDPENARRGIAALTALGYRPSVPVNIEDFTNPAKRAEWIREKDATVLSLYSEAHRTLPIDLFIAEPFDFARAHEQALREEVAPGHIAWFVSFEDLVAMKRLAGRPQDLADIHQLEEIRARLCDERESAD